MQLKLKRSQRDTGIVGTNVNFCLDARVEFTAEELANIRRYKLHKQVIYNSEASQKHIKSAAMSAASGSMVGSIKSLGSLAFAAMRLNISIEGLQKGTHIECKSMDELLGAEEAIMTACENLKVYLDTAATFDGREVLFDFAQGEPHIVATAHSPSPAAITQASSSPRATTEAFSSSSAAPAGVDPRYLPDLDAYQQSSSFQLGDAFSGVIEEVRGRLPQAMRGLAPAITIIGLILATYLAFMILTTVMRSMGLIT